MSKSSCPNFKSLEEELKKLRAELNDVRSELYKYKAAYGSSIELNDSYSSSTEVSQGNDPQTAAGAEVADISNSDDVEESDAHETDTFKCYYCLKKFQTREERSAHAGSCGKKFDESELKNLLKEIICGACNRRFANRDSHFQHLKNCNKLKEYVCLECDKEFPLDKYTTFSQQCWPSIQHNENIDLSHVIWSDEKTFSNQGSPNVQNHRYWSSANPHQIIESNNQYKYTVNVWCG